MELLVTGGVENGAIIGAIELLLFLLFFCSSDFLSLSLKLGARYQNPEMTGLGKDVFLLSHLAIASSPSQP